MHLPLWSHLEDVTYQTTQAQSILAILLAHFFLFKSPLYPRCPSSFHTFLRPTHPPLLLGVYFLVLSTSWLAEHGERQNTDDPSHFPHLKVQIWLRQIKAHSDMSKKWNATFNKVVVKTSDEHVQGYKETLKMKYHLSSSAILSEGNYIRSTKPQICRQRLKLKLWLKLIRAGKGNVEVGLGERM